MFYRFGPNTDTSKSWVFTSIAYSALSNAGHILTLKIVFTSLSRVKKLLEHPFKKQKIYSINLESNFFTNYMLHCRHGFKIHDICFPISYDRSAIYGRFRNQDSWANNYITHATNYQSKNCFKFNKLIQDKTINESLCFIASALSYNARD